MISKIDNKRWGFVWGKGQGVLSEGEGQGSDVMQHYDGYGGLGQRRD